MSWLDTLFGKTAIADLADETQLPAQVACAIQAVIALAADGPRIHYHPFAEGKTLYVLTQSNNLGAELMARGDWQLRNPLTGLVVVKIGAADPRCTHSQTHKARRRGAGSATSSKRKSPLP